MALVRAFFAAATVSLASGVSLAAALAAAIKARPKYYARLARLKPRVQAHEAAMRSLTQAHPEDTEAAIFLARAFIANPKTFGVVAEEDGRVIGSNFLSEGDPIRYPDK